MTPPASRAELERLLAQAVFAREYDFRLHTFGEGQCTLRVPFQPKLERPGGMVGGPAFMAAADVAMWMAVLTRLGPADVSVTTELNTAFLSAARREDFYCSARILKLGRRLIFGAAECVSLDGRLLTHHTVTYARPDASAGGPG
jgi:uncharacterized protein (TIGR00369 family)